MRFIMSVNFADLGIEQQLVDTLSGMNIVTPTPVQEKSIPHVLEGKDLLAAAQTGTGKTAAFGLPIIQSVQQKKRNGAPQALILVPTRELAQQVMDNLIQYAANTDLKIVCVYGDSLFDFSLRNMISDHKKKKSFITMSLYEHKTSIQYGVIDTKNNGKVLSWNEKPEIKSKINMGCYVMEPTTLNFIPKNKPYGMDDVIKKAISKRKTVNSILIRKGFVDVGDKKTYEKLRLEHKKRGKI